jgi:hypothetical protein
MKLANYAKVAEAGQRRDEIPVKRKIMSISARSFPVRYGVLLMDWFFPSNYLLGLVMKRRFWFGCPHEFLFPMKSSDGSFYQVCTRCGAEYGYDWIRMRRTKLLPRRVQQTSLDRGRSEPASAGRKQESAIAGSTRYAEISTSALRVVRLVTNAVESWAAAAKRWGFSRHHSDPNAGLLRTPRSGKSIRLASFVVLVAFLALTYVVVHRSGRAVPQQKSPEVAAPLEVAAHSATAVETAVSNEAAPV